MRSDIQRLLSEAAASKGWTSNTGSTWHSIIRFIGAQFGVDEESIHATKIQTQSARKSLWQGRLHRTQIPILFLAANEQCTEVAFERLVTSVRERFNPPARWADAALVISGEIIIGVVERTSIGLGKWMRNANSRIDVVECSPVDDQIELKINGKSLSQGDPRQFIRKIEKNWSDVKKLEEYLVELFGMETNQFVISKTGNSANAAKGRWEGADIDPSQRFRLGVVGATYWEWGNAASELLHRMEPPDLSIDMAIVCAMSENGGWNHFHFLLRGDMEGAEIIANRLIGSGFSAGEVEILDGKIYTRDEADAPSTAQGKALNVRDQEDVRMVKYEVSRPRRRLHDSMTNWLKEWADQQKLEISEGNSDRALYDAMIHGFDGKKDMLVEVKTGSDPGIVRLAVGQLLDYRRVLCETRPRPQALLLIPADKHPSQDMRKLLKELGFSWATLEHDYQEDKSVKRLRVRFPDGSETTIPEG